jgi:hypothetical protein
MNREQKHRQFHNQVDKAQIHSLVQNTIHTVSTYYEHYTKKKWAKMQLFCNNNSAKDLQFITSPLYKYSLAMAEYTQRFAKKLL